MNLVLGANGLLGSALMKALDGAIVGLTRDDFDLAHKPKNLPPCDVAYLCAGTKGFRECEGNSRVFRNDVDGNLRVAKHLLKAGAFVVFVSTDGVEWGAHMAYARNRLLVEMALVMQPHVAIVRAGKFDANNVTALAELCRIVGNARYEGLHYWP